MTRSGEEDEYNPTCADRAEEARLSIATFREPGRHADAASVSRAAADVLDHHRVLIGSDHELQAIGSDLLANVMHLLDLDGGPSLFVILAKVLSGQDEPEASPVPYELVRGLHYLAEAEGTSLDYLARTACLHHDDEVREETARLADEIPPAQISA